MSGNPMFGREKKEPNAADVRGPVSLSRVRRAFLPRRRREMCQGIQVGALVGCRQEFEEKTGSKNLQFPADPGENYF